MSQSTSNRRSYGTGTLYLQAKADGQEVWYGRWHLGEVGSTVVWEPAPASDRRRLEPHRGRGRASATDGLRATAPGGLERLFCEGR
jgi:hypothetical protein